MKSITSYIGDSSDGEEQANIEESYKTANSSYIEHLNTGLDDTVYKYEYIFKDIGARLLHHTNVDTKYFKIKKSYQISQKDVALKALRAALKIAIRKATELLKDKYIIGKYISLELEPDKETAADYYKYNEDNIKDLISKDFPLLHEEESFLRKLETTIIKYSGKFTLDKFEGEILNLYKYLYNNWGYNFLGIVVKLAEAFSIEEVAQFKFREEIQQLISKDDLSKILESYKANPVRAQILEVPSEQANYFLKRMLEEHKAIHIREQQLLEYGIKNLRLFSEDTSNTAATFLAKIRAYHKFMRGIIKDMLILNGEFATQTLSFTNAVGTAIYKDPEHPALGTLEISSIHKIYKSGARTTMVYGSSARLDGKYVKLAEDLEKLNGKANLRDWFIEILKGQEHKDTDWNKIFSPEEQQLLYDFTFLLFGCEVTRNIGALLTNAMFFDLVKIGYYSIEDIANKLPIAMEDAVPSSIKADQTFQVEYGETDGILSSVLFYDFRVKVTGADTVQLNKRDKALFHDWYIFYKIKVALDFHTNLKALNVEAPISDLQKVIGEKAEICVGNQDQLIKDSNKEFIVEHDGYKVEMKIVEDIEGKIKGAQFTIKEVAAEALHDLINEWYGLDIAYLEGEILLQGQVAHNDNVMEE